MSEQRTGGGWGRRRGIEKFADVCDFGGEEGGKVISRDRGRWKAKEGREGREKFTGIVCRRLNDRVEVRVFGRCECGKEERVIEIQGSRKIGFLPFFSAERSLVRAEQSTEESHGWGGQVKR